MPSVSPRVTENYLRQRLWLAIGAVGLVMLIAAGVGWSVLSGFRSHGSYSKVLTDLVEAIDNFHSDLAWFSNKDDQAEQRQSLRTSFGSVVEIFTLLSMRDGKQLADLDERWRFIKYEFHTDPNVLKSRYDLAGDSIPAAFAKLWHTPGASGKSLEASIREFIVLSHKRIQPANHSSADYQANANALHTLMKSELRPAFREAMREIANGTTNTARIALYLVGLCAVAGIAASLASARYILKPMVRSALASQDALQRERDRALASDVAKRDFLSMMSHELRTPLNGILGFTNLLLGTPLEAKQKEYAETVHAAGMTLLDLLNDIIDITHIEAGRVELEKVSFSLEDVAAEVLSVLGPQAFAKRLDLGAYIDPALPRRVQGDVGRLRQVLAKLAGNAIKFTEHGGVAMEIKAGADRFDRRLEVLFTIADTGIGIPRDQVERVFEQFTQVDNSSSRKHGGAGLGLPICRKLVEMMDGELAVESVLGRGSTFAFRVMLEPVSPPAKKIIDSSDASLEGRRFLVVDDNAINRNLFRLQLQGYKGEVDCASSGRAALTALEDADRRGLHYDVAIIDHMMPEMDGITLRNLIRAQPKYASMKLIISSSGGIAFDQQARVLGFDAACPKPVVQEKLVRQLHALLQEPSLAELAKVHADPETGTSLAVIERPRLPPRLLVAEDNHMNQRLIITQLVRAGYIVDAVGDGVEAVHAMQRLPYDLILMDIRMPIMSGVDATRRIRSMPGPAGKCPIIAMTANTLPGDREEYLAAGMNEYVPKPIDFDDLLDKIKAHLNGAAPELPAPDSESPLRAPQRQSN